MMADGAAQETARRAHRGRGRLSSIEMLPEEADEAISWANERLHERKMPQTEIHRQFNAMLTEHALPPVTWSTFSRYSLRLAQEMRRVQASRDITNAVFARYGVEDGSDGTLAAVELVKARLVQMIVEQDESDPEQLAKVTLALSRLSSTALREAEGKRRDDKHRWEENEREEALRLAQEKAEAEETAATVQKIATEAGLPADRIQAIRRGVLGLAA